MRVAAVKPKVLHLERFGVAGRRDATSNGFCSWNFSSHANKHRRLPADVFPRKYSARI